MTAVRGGGGGGWGYSQSGEWHVVDKDKRTLSGGALRFVLVIVLLVHGWLQLRLVALCEEFFDTCIFY